MGELDPDPARRLVAAVILSAVKSALQGDDQARAWLAGEGATWAEDALDITIDVCKVRADVVRRIKDADLSLLESA